METSRVYIVDDEPLVRASLVALISSVGIEAVSFASGAEFFQQFTPNEVSMQCVLADFRMTDMSGLDLREQLVAEGCDVPVILLTGFCSNDVTQKARSLGVFEILEKPCRPEQLESVVRRAFEFHAVSQMRTS